jgi:hypothetical protein
VKGNCNSICIVVALTATIGLGGCAAMSVPDQKTLAGAGVSGVAGAVLTNSRSGGLIGPPNIPTQEPDGNGCTNSNGYETSSGQGGRNACNQGKR